MYGVVCVSGVLMVTMQLVCAYRNVDTIIFMPIGIFNLTSLPADFAIRMPGPNTHRTTLMEGMGMNDICKLCTGSSCHVIPVQQTPGAPAYRFIDISHNVCLTDSYP